MYSTGNPVPSNKLEDMADNAQTFDALVTKTEGTTTDRLGRTRRVFQQILMDMGFQPLSGSFQTGATITARNQTLYDEVSHVFYAWGGVIPEGGYVVPAGSTPATSGGIGATAWVDRTDLTLRGELSSTDGAGLIGSISYAQLRSYSGSQTTVNVWGIYDVFDGAAGIFKVKTSDTTSADNGGTILVDASGRRWYRFFSGPINVRWFGAKGDGVTDDTAAFQKAFDVAAAKSESSAGGPITSNASVFVPDGVYYIAGTVTVDKRIGLSGDSANTVITGTSPSATSPSTCGFRFNSPATTGIAPQIENLTFFGFQHGPCVNIETSGAIITDCFFSSSQEAIRLTAESGGGPASDIVISDIIFDQNLVDVQFQSAINVTMSNCNSFLANTPLYFIPEGHGNSDINVSNCQFNYTRLASVFMDNAGGNKNVQINGCSFMLNGQHSTFLSFVYIGPNAGSVELFLNNCNFRNWKSYAIKMLSANVLNINSCVFDTNKTLGGYKQSAASTGIQFIGATIPTPVLNCQFRNIQRYAIEASKSSVVSVANAYLINTASFLTQDGSCVVNQSGTIQQNLGGGKITQISNQASFRDIGTLRFVALASDPAGAAAGDVYYNSTINKLRCYNGEIWNDLF